MSKTYVYFVRGAAHRDMCLMSVLSAKRADPQARVLVCTDDDTDLSAFSGICATSHMKFAAPMRIMPANVAVQTRVVLSAYPADEIWFLDSDTLLLKPLDMPSRADLLFTWRDHVGKTDAGEEVEGVARHMPYNYGVVGVTVTCAAREAFLWMRERIRGYNAQYQEWYGNQLAAVELAGPAAGGGLVTRPIPLRPFEPAITTVDIARVPCAEWNYTPQAADEDLTDKLLLHFKGARRDLMPVYARQLGVLKEEKAA